MHRERKVERGSDKGDRERGREESGREEKIMGERESEGEERGRGRGREKYVNMEKECVCFGDDIER